MEIKKINRTNNYLETKHKDPEKDPAKQRWTDIIKEVLKIFGGRNAEETTKDR